MSELVNHFVAKCMKKCTCKRFLYYIFLVSFFTCMSCKESEPQYAKLHGISEIFLFNDLSCTKNHNSEIRCWGSFGRGDCNRKRPSRNTHPCIDDNVAPTLLNFNGLNGIKELSANKESICIIDNSGEVWCKGYNRPYGSNKSSKRRFMKVPLEKAIKLSSAEETTCALTEKNGLYCFGPQREYYGSRVTKLEHTFDIIDVDVVNTVFPKMGAPQDNDFEIRTKVCVKTSNSDIYCWKNYMDSGPTKLDLYECSKKITTEPHSVCILSCGGEIACYFANNGWLKNWDGTDKYTSVPSSIEGIDGIVDIAVNKYQFCYLKDDDVRCIVNPYGTRSQIGDYNFTTFVPFVKTMSSSDTHFCVITKDTGVRCWGENKHGQSGNDGSKADEIWIPQ